MFECKAIQKTSKKGSPYICLEVTFPNGYKKLVFLEKAEEFFVIDYLE